MQCELCQCTVDQAEADAANELREESVGEGCNPLTLCVACAGALNRDADEEIEIVGDRIELV